MPVATAVALCALVGFSPIELRAQHDDPLEEVEVIGTYLADGAADAETRISLDRDELEAIMPSEPEQLLQRLPGVSVFRPGGAGGVSEIFLRGAESNFTAVYVDGMRLNDSANTRGGSFDFSTLAANDIGRVDIGMGAMSAIYGSDAMAGVIRIDTAYPEAGSGTVYAEAGTEDDWRAGAAGSLALGDRAALGLRISEVDGGDAVDGSSLDLTSISARLSGRRPGGDAWRIDVRHTDRSRTSYPEISGGPELALLPDLETAEGTQTGVSAQSDWTVSDNWQMEFLGNWVDIENHGSTPAVPPGLLDGQPAFTSDSEYRRGQLLWINRVRLGTRARLAFGLDLIEERGRDDGMVDFGFALLPNGFSLDRTTATGFVELANEWAAGLESTIAVRIDHTDVDTRLSGKLGLAKAIGANGGRLWARAANGFKLPSFFALGNPLFGNPDLKPEEVTSFELGYDLPLGDRAMAGISLFTSEYRDLVDFDFETFTNVNRGVIDIDGVHLYGRVQVSDAVWLRADATLTDISSAAGELRRRPETTGGLHLTWEPLPAWSVDAAARYIGERLITSIPTGDIRDDAYLMANVTVRYRATPFLALWLAVDNLFDSNYQDAPGFPAPGSRARLGAELRF
ncbi:TonB-dependent receptor plug domain-containing protein [Elongatibacter sediminis]|uniref:TonB-dependent receptor n=1 Tax=Elongatibacter sediminis TaxID=3119006 RepID=A0AAW9RDZ6_9GAMM